MGTDLCVHKVIWTPYIHEELVIRMKLMERMPGIATAMLLSLPAKRTGIDGTWAILPQQKWRTLDDDTPG